MSSPSWCPFSDMNPSPFRLHADRARVVSFGLCVALAGVFALTRPARADVVVELDVNTHVDPQKSADARPGDTHTALELTLMPQQLIVRTASTTTLYDFASRKRVVLDNIAQTRVDYSLYDVVGFRLIELRNRERLAKVLAAAKVAQALITATDNEHDLAIQETPSTPLQTSRDALNESFSNGTKPMFQRSVAATPVEASDAQMFAQFMRYQFGGHPQILDALARSGAIPAQMTLTTYNVVTTTANFTIRSVRAIAAAPPDITAAPLRSAAASSDPVDRALDRGSAITPAEVDAAIERSDADRSAAFGAGRSLDAVLSLLEWSLMTGKTPPVLSPEQQAAMNADADVQRLRAALAAHTKEQLLTATQTLIALRASASRKANVLKIFEANDRGLLGDGRAAVNLLLEALDENPCIASAYKDLGDKQLLAFDAPRAWRSWDIGRRIAPNLENFSAVAAFEQSLATGHPEYF